MVHETDHILQNCRGTVGLMLDSYFGFEIFHHAQLWLKNFRVLC